MSRGGDHEDLGLNHGDQEKLHWFWLFQVYTGVMKSIMQHIAFSLPGAPTFPPTLIW